MGEVLRVSAATLYGWPFESTNGRIPGPFAVLDPIEPGYSVRVATTAGDTARTVKAVADSLPYTDEQASVVVEDSDRIDPDVMEHTRQSRLQRWQEQRT